MATKKHICKQLRQLAQETHAEIISKENVLRVQRRNGKHYMVKKKFDMASNPYSRLKRAYKRGATKLDLLSRSQCKKSS